MDSTAEIRMTLSEIRDAEKRVADQVEKVYLLKSAHLNAERAETKLTEQCARLASLRVRFSKILLSIRAYRIPDKLLQETADVGGPRWRIGWAGTI